MNPSVLSSSGQLAGRAEILESPHTHDGFNGNRRAAFPHRRFICVAIVVAEPHRCLFGLLVLAEDADRQCAQDGNHTLAGYASFVQRHAPPS
jgi:hypothetical protein